MITVKMYITILKTNILGQFRENSQREGVVFKNSSTVRTKLRGQNLKIWKYPKEFKTKLNFKMMAIHPKKV